MYKILISHVNHEFHQVREWTYHREYKTRQAANRAARELTSVCKPDGFNAISETTASVMMISGVAHV
ncbi:hypothetical protein RZO85_06090 [Raoultella ornithinolytica]|mgnify:CR=1 FL=1|uniref:hypothetical protein n=1 Tax=Klebsiella/Raoultella group TaxID=2890311 RepID=UPI00292C8A46|nr:hypothetical protein [Raoultella ornithinolytica]MDV0599293.1 hypothetical protein [Raoultella ornithinolytica]HAW1738426.1 hypothetical protein [Escherichia coli]HDH7803700.1 hypothetical protein [Raoultella ornithinolytica]